MRVNILDHGYLELVEHWGSDERIIEAARMSTAKGFLGWGHYRQCRRCDGVSRVDVAGSPSHPGGCSAERDAAGMAVGLHDWRDVPQGDMGLLRYLWTHDHATPFEMAGLTIEVQAPIFVFREWHRHRVPFGYNELSARYTPMPDVNYAPSVERLLINAGGTNKQAGTVAGSEALTEGVAQDWLAELADFYTVAEDFYQRGLKAGVPKELARVCVPVGRYSRMRATGNLRGWLGFLRLRMAPNAQWEIRQYANAVGSYIAERFPRTWELFAERAR